MPSARALRSYLRSLALAPKPLRSLSPTVAGAPCALRLQGWLSGRCVVSEIVRGGTADGVRAGGENYATPLCCPIVSHVLAPATLRVLRSAPAWPKKL